MTGRFVLDSIMVRLRKRGKDVSLLLPGLVFLHHFLGNVEYKQGGRKPLAANYYGTDVDRGG